METGNGAHMDDALAFVPSGANLLEAVRGERNGEGVEYQLLVIDQPSPEGLSPGQHGPNRVLLLLRGNGDGRWQLAARNDTLVPCSTRGGLSGDPFAYAMVEEDTFSVITNGGSRQRWSSTYTLLLLYEVALALFIGLGPLFILCLLFEQTKTLFQKWLFYGIGTMFSMAVLSAMISIPLDMVIRVSASFWASALIEKFLLDPEGGVNMTSQALQQGGMGLILTTLILTAPPMAAMFFQGTMGGFMAYSQIGGSPVAAAPGPNGQPPGSYAPPSPASASSDLSDAGLSPTRMHGGSQGATLNSGQMGRATPIRKH